jgi:hypothetical protein
MIQLHFDNLHMDIPRITSWSDAILRVVADFEIRTDRGVLYREVEFWVVELACQLHQWIICSSSAMTEFEYASMETDENPMIWFRRMGAGWALGAHDQDFNSPALVDYDAFVNGARTYLVDLDARLDAAVGIRLLPILLVPALEPDL